MAHALEADPVNQLEEILECSVCREPLKDPRTLPCFHSFCKVCLECIVKTRRNQAPRGRPIRQFPCPNCREEFTLEPDKEVADMRPNHFICNLVQATAIFDRETGVPCSNNCSKSLSVAYCVNCEIFLCTPCLTAHNNYRGHDSHSVLTMAELSKPEKRMKIKGKMYCKAHKDEPLKIYCETCDQLICRDCMDFKHARENHSCLLVKDVANNYKELLHSSNNVMINALNESNELLNSLTFTSERLDCAAKTAKANIVQRKEEMTRKVLEILNQQTQKRLIEVDQIHRDERAKLDRLRKDTEHYAVNIKRSVQLSKKLVDLGREEEIVSSQKMMLDNAKRLLVARRPEYFNASIPEVKLIYTARTAKEPSNEEISRLVANSLGAVRKQNKDIDESVIGDKLKIHGTELQVECWDAASESTEEGVSRIWSTDEVPLTPENGHTSTKTPVGKGSKRSFGTDAQQEKMNERRSSSKGDDHNDDDRTSKGASTTVPTEKLSCVLDQNVKLVVYKGDLMQESVDAIVNPANAQLQHGGVAAGAILKAGGKTIQDESDNIMKVRGKRPLQPGAVEVTGSGKLPCKFVIHAVGPIWGRDLEQITKSELYATIHNSLCLVCQNRAKSISIPAISSGLYQVPVEVSQVLFNAVVDFTSSNSGISLEEIRFVNIDSSTNRTFAREMEKRFGDKIKREKMESQLTNKTKGQERATSDAFIQVSFSKSDAGPDQKSAWATVSR